MTAYKSVAQKLLIKADYKVLAVNAPQDYAAKLGELSLNVSLLTQSDAPVDLVHISLLPDENWRFSGKTSNPF